MNRLLYVEDERDIRDIALISLRDVGGFDVSLSGSGPDALRRVAALHPDVILLDVMMPGMDGPTTLRELRKIPEVSQTPVIFMTAKVQGQEIEALKQMGALDVIAKPFEPLGLADQVRDILRLSEASSSLERVAAR